MNADTYIVGLACWTPIDAEAEREGRAVLRLQRRTGLADPTAADLQNRAPGAGRHIFYNRADAIAAFERLFAGAPQRRELPATRADVNRRRQQRQRREADRRLGESLRGMTPDQIRAAFKQQEGITL